MIEITISKGKRAYFKNDKIMHGITLEKDAIKLIEEKGELEGIIEIFKRGLNTIK